MSSMSEANLEKKFQTVSNTQDSIQSLSLWILHHKAHSTKIVNVWMKVLKKAKIGHRLTLFYLANDVIQNGKRRGAGQFVGAFSEVLREAILLLKDDKIKGSIERVLKIWEDRSVYTSETISDLLDILSSAKICKDTSAKILAEFKPENVTDNVQKIQRLEVETASKLSALNSSKLEAATSEVLSQLKDRSHGQRFSKEFDDATLCLEEYIKSLEKENKAREDAIVVLEQAEIYYDTQRGEARVVANAYKNFAARVKNQKKKLEDHMTTLPSPVPSPCPDAPSPSNSEGLDLSPILEAPDASPPSPIGTPDELKMSPSANQMDKDSAAINSFIPQGPGMMTSWLDSFTATSTAPSSEAGSLESRLLNFMQNIPGTPSKASSSTQPAKAAAAGLGSLTEPKNLLSGEDSRGGTPVKDENSGQETPVQDEDTQTTSPQQVLSKLMALTKGGKDLPDDLLKKFSPIAGFGSPLVSGDQAFKSSDVPSKNGFDSLLSDADSASWRTSTINPDVIVPKTETIHSFVSPFQVGDTDWRNRQNAPRTEASSEVHGKAYASPYRPSDSDHSKDLNESFSSPYEVTDSDIVDQPPWNTTGSFQVSLTQSYKDSPSSESTDVKPSAFHEPLQPPPKPSFPDFDIFNSPPPLTSKGPDVPSPVKSASATQSRQDPRLNSQNYATKGTTDAVSEGDRRHHGKHEADDNEPMDMDLDNSDSESDHEASASATELPLSESSRPSNADQDERQDTLKLGTEKGSMFSTGDTDLRGQVPEKNNYSETPTPQKITEDQKPSTGSSESQDSTHEDAKPISRPDDHFTFPPNGPPGPMEISSASPRSNERFAYSPDGPPGPQESRKTPPGSGDRFAFSPNGPPGPLESRSTPPRSGEQFQFSPDRPIEQMLSQSNDSFPYSQDRPPPREDYFPFSPDGPRSKYNPEMNLAGHPNHERMMQHPPPDMKPMIRDRDVHPPGPMPMPMRFPPLRREDEERWRTGQWNSLREPPPWHEMPRRFEGGRPPPFEDFEFNGRGGPYYDDFGPPPKRFQLPPPPHFGRRGFYSPRH